MKTKILFFLFLTSTLNCFSQESLDNGKKLELISYLTYVKALSEQKMISLSQDKEYEKMHSKTLQFNSEYNLLKLATDKLINQLSADLYSKNNLTLYKKINHYLKGTCAKFPNSKYSQYSELISEIDNRLEVFLVRKYSGGALAGASLEEITGAVEQVRGIITDARDFREKKIQSITGVLTEHKMLRLSEIVKQREKRTLIWLVLKADSIKRDHIH